MNEQTEQTLNQAIMELEQRVYALEATYTRLLSALQFAVRYSIDPEEASKSSQSDTVTEEEVN